MVSEEDFHLIEAYIEGKLSVDEVILFEKKLQQDQSFNVTYEEVKNLKSNIEIAFLKENMNDFHKSINNLPPKKALFLNSKTFKYVLSIAAVFIVGLGIFWNLKPNKYQNIYNNYYTQDPGLPTVMGERSNFQFYDGMVNYKKEEYAEALNKWTTLLQQNPKNDTLHYFIGMAYLGANQDHKAITHLENVGANKFSAFYNEANYYKALYLIKQEKLEEAKKLLLNLKDHLKAKQLLKEMNEL